MKNRSVMKKIFPILFALFAVIIGLFSNAYADPDGDTYAIARVVNGLYGEENYCLFIHPLLCSLIRVIDSIFISADGYVTYLLLVIFISVLWLTHLVLIHATDHLLLGLTAVFLLFVAPVVPSLNFTIQTAIIAGGALWSFLAVVYLRRATPCMIAIPVLLCICACLLRFDAVLLCIPFAALSVFTELLSVIGQKEERKKVLTTVLHSGIPLILTVVVLFGMKYQTDHSEKYKAATDYNSARSAVVDYPLKWWDEDVAKQLPGITENDYNSVRSWQFADTDRIDTEYYQAIARAGAVKTKSVSLWKIFDDMIYWGRQVQQNVFAMTLIVAILLVTVYIFVGRVPMKYKLQQLIGGAGTALICLFFLIKGRLPVRVVDAVLIPYLVSSVCIVLFRVESNKKDKIAGIIQIGLLAVCISCFSQLYCSNYSPNTALTAKTNYADTLNLVQQKDAVYVWNIYASYTGNYKRQNKLPPNDVMKHNMPEGGWTYGQVYFKEFWQKNGVINPMKEMLYNPKVYYVSYDVDAVLTYMQEHYSAQARAEIIDTINDIPVWNFYE